MSVLRSELEELTGNCDCDHLSKSTKVRDSVKLSNNMRALPCIHRVRLYINFSYSIVSTRSTQCELQTSIYSSWLIRSNTILFTYAKRASPTGLAFTNHIGRR